MSKDNMMVFGYARVSTENQLENYSIEEQSARLKSYCAAKGWALLHTYVDGGYSGGNMDRPALQAMLARIRQTHVDAVVVYKLDRLSRSQKDTLTLIEDELLARGTDFVSINENFDTSTPFGRAMIGILSVFAQLEKDQITERFTMGRIGRGKAGYFHGGGNAPTGYNYGGGLLTVNQYEAIQVREAFDLFLSGKSINAIWHILSAKYITKWTAAKVRNVLKNSLYIGKVHFMGQEYEGVHQPIVAKATFVAANQLLASLSRAQAKTTSQRSPFRAGYLLSGLLYCGRCGARYAANHGYYKCYSRAKSTPKFVIDPNCKNDHWAIAVLDALVCGQATVLISNPSAMDRLIKASNTPKAVHLDKDQLRRTCADLERQIDRLLGLYQIGSIPIASVAQRVNDLSAQKSALEAQLDIPDETPTGGPYTAALEDYRRGFEGGDTDRRRALLAGLLERVIIDGQTIRLYWRI